MIHYKSFGYVETFSQDYDSIEQFTELRSLSYDYPVELETTLDNYPADYVKIPNGKLFMTAEVPYIIPGYITKSKIYKNVGEIFLGLATNFTLINKKVPDIYILKYLEELNRNHTYNFLSFELIEEIHRLILKDRDNLKEYGLEYRDSNGNMKIYGFIENKTEWVNPNAKDKKSTYYNRYKLSNQQIINNLPNRKVTIKELSILSPYSSERTFDNSLTSDQKAIIKAHNKKYNKR